MKYSNNILKTLPILILVPLVISKGKAKAAVCPAVGADTDCGSLITITNTGATPSFTGQGPYDGEDDTLVGVVNNSNQPIRALGLASSSNIFGFDGDGIVSYGASGNARDSSGYGGPNAYFTNINSSSTTGNVNFITPIAPGGTGYFSLENALNSSTSCQQVVNNAVKPVASGAEIRATFTPNLGLSLNQAAGNCGFKNFDWEQKITNLPAPSPFKANGSNTPLTAPPTFNDPPPGGYQYQPSIDNSYPFYYDPKNDELASHETATTLSFYDAPADPCLPGGSGDGCGGMTAPAGSYIAFTTNLVGVLPDNSLQDLGIGFSWTSNFNGTSGGVARTKNDLAVDPGSGTGGITITGETDTTTYQYGSGITITGIFNAADVSNPVKVPEPSPVGILTLSSLLGMWLMSRMKN